jgi:hypothetical protein
MSRSRKISTVCSCSRANSRTCGAAGVGRGFPIHVAGALEGLVRADAVKVLAQAAVVRLDFSGDAGQQIVEAGLRVDGRVDQHFAPQGDARGFFQEAEGEEVENAKLFWR